MEHGAAGVERQKWVTGSVVIDHEPVTLALSCGRRTIERGWLGGDQPPSCKAKHPT